ncbi:MAG: hypothetical protein BWK79_19530 [Beggiatoa sp. IS2]|nr:MAG: hypothetical protein BWK79_19530 [Beggiatoa sp. IS2]
MTTDQDPPPPSEYKDDSDSTVKPVTDDLNPIPAENKEQPIHEETVPEQANSDSTVKPVTDDLNLILVENKEQPIHEKTVPEQANSTPTQESLGISVLLNNF